MTISGDCEIYLEHTGHAPVLLPRHRMRGALYVGEQQMVFKPNFWRALHDATPAPDYGVHVRDDGVVATGPGIFSFNVSIEAPLKLIPSLRDANEIRMTLSFAISGNERALALAINLRRYSDPDFVGIHHRIGDWRYREMR